MTLWDMQAAKRYLKEKHITEYNEDDLFSAYERLAEIEKEAAAKTKKYKLRKSKTPKMSEISSKKTEIKPDNESVVSNNDMFTSLFEDIEAFDISEDES